MPIEIERKFLVATDEWRSGAIGVRYRQGYLMSRDTPQTVVRIRIEGDRAYLTIKGQNKGISRPEYQYEIPLSHADEMLNNLCAQPLIEKKRYKIEYDGQVWEIDEFDGDNHGLIIAEIELHAENEAFSRPPWLGREVTDDPRYYNANLVRNPYCAWK